MDSSSTNFGERWLGVLFTPDPSQAALQDNELGMIKGTGSALRDSTTNVFSGLMSKCDTDHLSWTSVVRFFDEEASILREPKRKWSESKTREKVCLWCFLRR